MTDEEQPPIVIHEHHQLVETPPLTRRGLFVVTGVIGMALAIVIIFVTILYIDLRHVERDNNDAIARLDRIQHPTKKQFIEDLESGIARCLKVPQCRVLFPGVSNQKKRTMARRRRTTDREARIAHRLALIYARREGNGQLAGPSHSGAPQPPARVVPRPHHTGHRHTPPSSAPTPSPSGGASGNPPPPPPRPLVGVTTNLPAPVPNPKVCTQLARVNC